MQHPTKASEVPFRLVLHRGPGGDSHLDLFVRVAGQEALLTYEIARGDWVRATHARTRPPKGTGKQTAKHSGPDGKPATILAVAQTGSEPLPKNSLLARRKADHRAIYWSHSGPVAGNRGRIREICQGLLLGFYPMATLSLTPTDFC